MLTRTTAKQEFLLKPSAVTNQVILYVLATYAKKWQVDLHAVVAMSNHWHVCLTDRKGTIVDFQRDCHAFIARALNVAYEDIESVWSRSQTSRVELREPFDLLDKMSYTLANPVEAGLVRQGKKWPGVRGAWPQPPQVIERPKFFFTSKEEEGGTWPAAVELEFTRPPGYDDLTDAQVASELSQLVKERERAAREKADAEGRKFLGRRGVLAQSRNTRPKKLRKFDKGKISPRVAARNKWRRIESLMRNKQWEVDHRTALRRWQAGDRDVVFPYGTYKMRVVHGVRCAERPPDDWRAPSPS